MLFSIFISNLGTKLNQTGLGITLGNVNISTIFFADDIVVMGKDKSSLDKLMRMTRDFCKNHHLEISTSKSKVMTHSAEFGTSIFGDDEDNLSLDQVVAFKYLGITVSTKAHGFFKNHNENAKAKSRQYMQRVLSLVKTGPDRTDLAYSLWVNCALPAILYGCEVVPLNQGTIQEIERCQARVGKFILQVPSSSSSVSTNIDCGFKPIWSVIAERVLLYSHHIMSKPATYWPKMSFLDHINRGTSGYVKYLNKWKDATNSFGVHTKQIRKNVKHFAIKNVYEDKKVTCTTSFALSCPGTTPENVWFRPKPWISDSCFTKTFAEFRVCNVGLGNRGPTKDGRFFKLCPLCLAKGERQLNNEVCIFGEFCQYPTLALTQLKVKLTVHT